MKTISKQTFEDLLTYGHCVPRYETSGEVIPAGLGRIYSVTGNGSGQVVKVKCTQTYPTHFIFVEDKQQ